MIEHDDTKRDDNKCIPFLSLLIDPLSGWASMAKEDGVVIRKPIKAISTILEEGLISMELVDKASKEPLIWRGVMEK